jgi:hypothetical protein
MASSTQIQTEPEQVPSAPVVELPTGEKSAATAASTAKMTAVDGQAQGSKQDGKPKGSKRLKKSKDGGADAEVDAMGPSVAAHPRAARGVARARGWAGLGGFLIAGYLSLPTGTLAGAGLRALIAGTVCYLVAWAGAVFLWRRLVMLELRAKEHALYDSADDRDASMSPVPPNGARAAV